jgi:hypothetical protein
MIPARANTAPPLGAFRSIEDHLEVPQPMNLNEFNSAVVKTETPDATELDLRPFGARQSEALDFWLPAALSQVEPFATKYIVKVDASVILSPIAFACLAKLQRQHLPVSLVRV